MNPGNTIIELLKTKDTQKIQDDTWILNRNSKSQDKEISSKC